MTSLLTAATTLDDIRRFVADCSGCALARIDPDSDLFGDLGIDGDDFAELMDAFATRFGVKMDGYCWQFHHGPEAAVSLGDLLPGRARQVVRVAVTPRLLLECALYRRWLVAYPDADHHIAPDTLRFGRFGAAGLLLAVMVGMAAAALLLP